MKKNGAIDPRTLGTVPNVGLMAQKAEEYGSHDKTFKIPAKAPCESWTDPGRCCSNIRSRTAIFGGCARPKTRRSRIGSNLRSTAPRLPAAPTVFWLDKDRAHDAEIIKKVEQYLQDHDMNGLDIRIMGLADATRFRWNGSSEGKDTISVSGNVLRDYLTDYVPDSRTRHFSAKMLSIVPLMNGGGLFETGAGGSAPKHVKQFQEKAICDGIRSANFWPWQRQLEHLAKLRTIKKRKFWRIALDEANAKFLETDKSPARKVGKSTIAASHFYLAIYWAEALAYQTAGQRSCGHDSSRPSPRHWRKRSKDFDEEFIAAQGNTVDVGGYYHPDEARLTKAMRPSPTLNAIVDAIA